MTSKIIIGFAVNVVQFIESYYGSVKDALILFPMSIVGKQERSANNVQEWHQNMSKPRFIPHECESEPGCKVCRDYVNKLDDHRQSISRGEHKREIIFRLARTSKLNQDSEGKGQVFDLPKPRFIQTIIMK